MRLRLAMMLVRRHLSDDLLQPKYRKRERMSKTSGHCYVATEALYYLLSPEQQKNFKPYYIKVNGDTHWYLMWKNMGSIVETLDPTFDQYPMPPNYSQGKRCGFLTKKPSKRTIILLKRIFSK